ncbi:MAG: AMP-binding protein [Halobacteriovoraceae bacterium]|nr:AMP-binding protein [Halobacteriovoraceae bacterium]MCB9094021.1 AMP-binding protein [Halobacteriovoraceae bacterium]
MSKIGYFEGAHQGNNVYSFLEKHVQENPDKEILTWVNRDTLGTWDKNLKTPLEHQSIKVKELFFLCERISAGFSELGIGNGDRVILFAPMSVPLYVCMFALQKLGAIPVFLDSWARRGQLGISAETVDPKAMISFEQAFDMCSQVPELAKIEMKISVGPTTKNYTSSYENLLETMSSVNKQAVEQEATALITFTTGSSGRPKGADRTHRFLAAQHYAISRSLKYDDNDRDMPVFPIFSLNNLAECVTTVIPAFDVGMPTENDPLIILAQVYEKNITCLTLSPWLFNKLSEYCLKNSIQLEKVKRVVTGGAPISRDNLVDFRKIAPNAEILVLYGSTEVEPIAHIEANDFINLKFAGDEDPELVDPGVNVGKIDSGLEYKFIQISKDPVFVKTDLDWENIELPSSQVGELIVSGEHVCENYYNYEEAFFRAKIRDNHNRVWHRTGDLGFIDNNGDLWLVGRVHNAIKRKDTFHFPVKAEVILKRLDFVSRGAYLGVSDAELGEKIVCVIEPTSNQSEMTKEEQKAEVNRLFNKNQVTVDQIIFYDKIPMDPRHHSKVEYEVLKNELRDKKLI